MVSTLRPAWVFYAVLLVSAGTLAAVLVAQYGLGLRPCELCLLQRYPYVALMGLAGVGLLPWAGRPAIRARLCLLCALVFLISAGLGGYHAGVEKNLFSGPSACVGEKSDRPLSIEELRKQILGAPIVACNEPAWQWHGLTMAGMNMALSLLMAAFLLRHYNSLKKERI